MNDGVVGQATRAGQKPYHPRRFFGPVVEKFEMDDPVSVLAGQTLKGVRDENPEGVAVATSVSRGSQHSPSAWSLGFSSFLFRSYRSGLPGERG